MSKKEVTFFYITISLLFLGIVELISVDQTKELQTCTIQEVIPCPDGIFFKNQTRVKYEDGFTENVNDKRGEVGEVIKVRRVVGRESLFGFLNKRF
jgi:hypothetical protein